MNASGRLLLLIVVLRGSYKRGDRWLIYICSMNMRDIAKRAGVSSATVSRVINGSPLVKGRTASRIRSILDEVGFIPNPHATTLKYGRSKMFGLIIPDISNPFYGEFLGAFEHLLGEIDHEILFTNVEDDAKLIASVRRMLMRQVDGVVIMASEFDTKAIEPLLLHKIALVTVDRRRIQRGSSDVAVDYETGFLQAVAHLKALGHKDIGYIGGNEGLTTSEVRYKAFQHALKSHQLKFNSPFVTAGNYRVDGGEGAIKALCSRKRKPTAVLTANDLTAFGALRGASELGLRVPEDLSIVGVDDILLADVMQPRLTTIRLPRQAIASTCLRALNHTKEDVDRRGTQFSVATELIVRGSTAKAHRY